MLTYTTELPLLYAARLMQHPPQSDLALCAAADLAEGTARGFELYGVSLFAIKTAGAICVYRNACPHLGIELNWQPDRFLDHSGTLIQCSTHGALFQMDTGRCIAGPCTGKQLQVIPHRIVDGILQVMLPSPLP